MVNQITTSTTSTATAYSNQRKIDRCSNGVLWTLALIAPVVNGPSADIAQLSYSTDNGATWTNGSVLQNGSNNTAATWIHNASFFIDQDDYAHVVFRDNGNGFVYYRRGTPNAGRTAWTWSPATTVGNISDYNYPDVIAHREGTGWTVHIVMSYVYQTQNHAIYTRIDITSGGTIGTPHRGGLPEFGTTTASIGGPFANSNPTYPSLDFNHTGDGKTVAGSTPHLYVAWSTGTTGVSRGIRFKKAAYSAGTWTWGTEREIDSTRYVWTNQYWLNCLFDGTRVIIGGQLLDNAGYADVVLYERDAADTGTTTKVLIDSSVSGNIGVEFYSGSMTYDSNGNVYILGIKSGTKYYYRKWTRATEIFDAGVTFDSTKVSETGYVSAKRGNSGGRVEFIYTDGTASPYSVKYSYVGDPNPEYYPASITTSTSATATAYFNQRKLDRTSNGVLWSLAFITPALSGSFVDIAQFSYSTDNGVTWTNGSVLQNGSTSTTMTYTVNGSFFIDQDDYCHVAFKDNSNGYIYYRRGTPNAGRTAWTWSSVIESSGTNDADSNYPDIVAHREGTGWKAHLIFSKDGSGGSTAYSIIDISSTGTLTRTNRIYLGSAYAGTQASFPSIDFNHTGDGKTVAGGTPHLYAAWSAGATGAGKGIRFKKATYSAGTWTWGTEREIDTTRFINGTTDESLQLLFDGVRVVIGSYEATNSELFLYERDAADTTTTIRFLASGTATSPAYYPAVLRPSISYDSEKNIYFVGHLYNTSYQHGYRKWVRGTNTLEPHVLMGSTTASRVHTSTKRGYSNNRIEFIYTDGTASPYTITFGMVQLNRTPTVVNPTPAGAVGKGDNLTVNWTYSDLDSDPQSKYQIRWRKIL